MDQQKKQEQQGVQVEAPKPAYSPESLAQLAFVQQQLAAQQQMLQPQQPQQQAVHSHSPVDASVASPPSYEAAVHDAGGSADRADPETDDAANETHVAGTYFGTLPENTILYRHQVVPISGPSTVKVQRSAMHNNVESWDMVLDDDVDELWKYFVTYASKPLFFIKVTGTHVERRTVHSSNGTRTETRTVTDFRFELDVTEYVQDTWTRIVCVPSGAGDKPMTIREALETYALSTNKLKEINLEKVIAWDVYNLKKAIKSCVRAAGYRATITVSTQYPGSKVSAYASHDVSRMARNPWMQALCVITCCCVVFAPVYYLARDKIKTTMVCEFGMKATPQEFYVRNYRLIMALVIARKFGSFKAM
ncbi:hypothetical protein BC831DRAFT_468444 [Entophlyctis helioformis]|nr:hypothetical protein BC831DRAFT_468444 [Entophlyctis helioformis]